MIERLWWELGIQLGSTHHNGSLHRQITEPLRLEGSQLPPSLGFLFMLDFCQGLLSHPVQPPAMLLDFLHVWVYCYEA